MTKKTAMSAETCGHRGHESDYAQICTHHRGNISDRRYVLSSGNVLNMVIQDSNASRLVGIIVCNVFEIVRPGNIVNGFGAARYCLSLARISVVMVVQIYNDDDSSMAVL